ncbi:MAG: HEAT repeat domain-containing protein, partial [Planctomycetota bacterium]
RLAELSQRADAQQTSLARVLLAELPASRDPLLGILRSLNAGFAAHDEDALDRHEDRLIARLALRVNALDDATARAAVAEQEARRGRGEPIRLGELLVEQGKIDAATAERLYRQFENAAVVCQDCFAPNARNRLAEGAQLECPRCGASAPVPPPAVKPGWTQMGGARVAGATSDLVYAEANQVVAAASKGDQGDRREHRGDDEIVETEPVEDAALPPKTPSGRNKPLAPQKRRRPSLAPAKKGSRLVAVLAIGGVLALFAGIVVVWVVLKPGQGAVRYGKFQDVIKIARDKKTGGAIEEAAQAYGAALDLFKDVKPPAEAEAAVAAALKEHEVCADFAKRTAKIAQDGDATPLCELAKTCEDHDVLVALVNRLALSKDAEAVSGLVTLSSSKDDEVRRVAVRSALNKGGTSALPLIEKILEREGDPFQKEAVLALLRINDKAAIPTIAKALDRFPKQEGLWLSAAQILASMKDPAAVPLLKKLAKDPRNQVAEAAIAGLAKVAPHEATAELVAGLDGGDAVAASCLEQLKKMGDSAIPPLVGALEKGQASAAVPLIAIATPRAIGAVTDTLPKLPWDKRGAVLELLTNGSAPGG